MGIVKITTATAGTLIPTDVLLKHNDTVTEDFWNQYVTNIAAGFSLYRTAMNHNVAVDFNPTTYIYAQIPPSNPWAEYYEGTYIEYASIYVGFTWFSTASGDRVFVYGGTDTSDLALLGTYLTTATTGSVVIEYDSIICPYYYHDTTTIKANPYFIRIHGSEDRLNVAAFSSVGVFYKKYPGVVPITYVPGVGTMLFSAATGSKGTYHGSNTNGVVFNGVGTNYNGNYQLGDLDGTKYLEIMSGYFNFNSSILSNNYQYLGLTYTPKLYDYSYKIAFTGNESACKIRLNNQNLALNFVNAGGVYTVSLYNDTTLLVSDSYDSLGAIFIGDMYITSPGGGNDLFIRFDKGLSLNIISLYYNFGTQVNIEPMYRFSSSGAGTSCIGISSMTGSWTI